MQAGLPAWATHGQHGAGRALTSLTSSASLFWTRQELTAQRLGSGMPEELFYGCAKSRAHGIACQRQCALAYRPRGAVRDTTERTAQGRAYDMSGLTD